MKLLYSNSERMFDFWIEMCYDSYGVMQMKSRCELDCSRCECYLATQADDDIMRMNVAVKWSRMFNRTILPREINCTGCLSEGPKFTHCQSCKIRRLEIGENVVNG